MFVSFFKIRLASVDTDPKTGITRDQETFEGCQFSVTRGDYSPLLKQVVEELKKAKVNKINFKFNHTFYFMSSLDIHFERS